MIFKAYPTTVTAAAADGELAEVGTFDAIVSVFGNRDAVGDVVEPGAYLDTIDAWAKSRDTLPVLWSHRMDDPHFNIGAVIDIAEIGPGDERIPAHAHPWVHANGGLWVRGQIDVGADASKIAVHARKLMLARRTTQFSFAYDVLDAERDEKAGVNRLKKLWLYEVSLTQVGANTLTELGTAKTAPAAEGGNEGPEVTGHPRPADLRLRCEIAAFSHLYG